MDTQLKLQLLGQLPPASNENCFREASCQYNSFVLMITRQPQTLFSGVSESSCVIGQTFGVGVANTDKLNCWTGD